MRMGIIRWVVVLAAAMLPATAMGDPVTYGFTGVSNNTVNDTNTGTAQLQVTVIDLGSSQVGFKFTNSGPNASSITDIYFDDGSLLGATMENPIAASAGVSFSQGAAPGILPAGNTINFNQSGTFFSADSNPAVQPNGVNPGEWVQVNFTLTGGQTFTDTITALNLALANPGVDVTGGLRIGIHVQGFDGGGSESFVNGGGNPTGVPLPAAALAGSALMGTLGLRRPSRRQ
jgi:hypothetical protein